MLEPLTYLMQHAFLKWVLLFETTQTTQKTAKLPRCYPDKSTYPGTYQTLLCQFYADCSPSLRLVHGLYLSMLFSFPTLADDVLQFA